MDFEFDVGGGDLRNAQEGGNQLLFPIASGNDVNDHLLIRSTLHAHVAARSPQPFRTILRSLPGDMAVLGPAGVPDQAKGPGVWYFTCAAGAGVAVGVEAWTTRLGSGAGGDELLTLCPAGLAFELTKAS